MATLRATVPGDTLLILTRLLPDPSVCRISAFAVPASSNAVNDSAPKRHAPDFRTIVISPYFSLDTGPPGIWFIGQKDFSKKFIAANESRDAPYLLMLPINMKLKSSVFAL
jgi:hypothetical protein